MLSMRKIDFGGQLVLAALMILSTPLAYRYGFMAGLFVMGIWQLISAILNTTTFMHFAFRKRIRIYWICWFADFAIFVLTWFGEKSFHHNDREVLFVIAIIGAIGIAVYYLMIYNKLIGSISLRNELDGLTKSKHLL